jgi:hypothetical protein
MKYLILLLSFISFGAFAQSFNTDKAMPTKTNFYPQGSKLYVKAQNKPMAEVQMNRASTFSLFNKKDTLNFDTYSFGFSNNGTGLGQSLVLSYVKAIPSDTVTYSTVLKFKDGNVGVGGTATVPFQVFGTKGSIPAPLMTTTQINAITSPTDGMLVYNTTLHVYCFYDTVSWKKVSHSAMN